MNAKTTEAHESVEPISIIPTDDVEPEYIGFRKATLGIPEKVNKDYSDPVVLSLAETDRPQVQLICQHCPGACFFTTHNALKCFCKHMNTLSWTTSDPIPITRCTAQGVFVAQWMAKQAEGG